MSHAHRQSCMITWCCYSWQGMHDSSPLCASRLGSHASITIMEVFNSSSIFMHWNWCVKLISRFLLSSVEDTVCLRKMYLIESNFLKKTIWLMQAGVSRLTRNAVRPPPSQMACLLLNSQNTCKQSSSSFNEVLSSVLIVLLSPQDRSQKVILLMKLPVLPAILKNRQERRVKEALIGQTHMLCTSLMLFLAFLELL